MVNNKPKGINIVKKKKKPKKPRFYKMEKKILSFNTICSLNILLHLPMFIFYNFNHSCRYFYPYFELLSLALLIFLSLVKKKFFLKKKLTKLILVAIWSSKIFSGSKSLFLWKIHYLVNNLFRVW